MMTTRVHIREPYEVFIGRYLKGHTCIWGNPFKIGVDGDRATVVRLHRDMVLSNEPLKDKIRKELSGKTLGCFCEPHQQCHGDIYVEIANEVSHEVKSEGIDLSYLR